MKEQNIFQIGSEIISDIVKKKDIDTEKPFILVIGTKTALSTVNDIINKFIAAGERY